MVSLSGSPSRLVPARINSALLERVERRNYHALTPDEIEEFALLYRGLSADLAAAP